MAYVLAVVLPAATALLLIPFREEHGRTLAIMLVVPVIAIAAVGATGPAVVAAITAGVAYDVFLTAPYQQFVFDDPDDVVAMITLIAVGLFVGVLSSRVVMLAARDATRHIELDHLVAFSHATTRQLSDQIVWFWHLRQRTSAMIFS
jgi:K+-sensing histidine kinase KdpD